MLTRLMARAGLPSSAAGKAGLGPQRSRRAMSEPEPPQVTWMLTSVAWPNARWPRGPDFTAFDGELLVGRVFQHQDGPEKGLWLWTMSVARPGLAFPGPTSGVEAVI